MERQKRFSGESYPHGMCAFPFRLKGQGFFPGGDGLWRDDQHLEEPSQGTLPINGLMFVGNDFGTLAGYLKLRKNSFENPQTWKNLRERVRRARLPESEMFFTNAVMGLRTEGKALDKKDWGKDPLFPEFCREFFVYQVETMKPRLLVIFSTARATIETLIPGENLTSADPSVARVGSHTVLVLHTTHPYPDFGFSEERRERDVECLARAWAVATARVRS